MHHVVTHLKLGKVLDFLPLVLGLPFLFLLSVSENIAFGNHHKLKQRISKAFSGMSVAG